MNNKELAKQEKQKGNSAFEAKRFQAAVDHFTTAIAADNTDHVLYSNRSAAYASLQEYSLALKDADECIRLQPNWAKGYSRKGVAEFHLGNKIGAREAFSAGLKIDPQNNMLLEGLKLVQNYKENPTVGDNHMVQAIRFLASNPKFESYLTDQDFVQTFRTALKELEESPASLQKWFSHSDTRLKEVLFSYFGIDLPEPDFPTDSKSKKEVTKPKVEPILQPHEKEANEYKEQGNAFYKKRCFEEALEAYDKAISTNPKEILFYYNKAALYLEQKEYELCLKVCEEAISKRYEMAADFSKVAKVFNRMAVCYERMKDYDNAIAMYEKSLMEDNNRRTRTELKAVERKKELKLKEEYINPGLAEKHREVANELFNNADYPSAKKEYDEAIRRNPKDARLFSNRAAALMKLLEFPSALKDCDAALEIDPNFVKAWARKGTILMHLKDYNKAMQAFDAGLAVNPESNECRTGKYQLCMKIKESGSSDEIDEARVQRGLNDPEIKEILLDPQFNLILKNLSENPASLSEYWKDPKIASGLQKLIAAGIVRMN